MTDKTGGPAFPHDKYMKHGDQWGTYAHGGMTLRDYFAAAAIPALIEKGMFVQPKVAAEGAYAIADAMIAVRATGEA